MSSRQLAIKAQEWRELARRYADDAEIRQRCEMWVAHYKERAKEQQELEELTPKY